MLDKVVSTLRGSVPLMLIATVCAVSVLAWLSDAVKQALLLRPYFVKKKLHVHRLLTAGWVHVDGMHLAFNMVTLWFFAKDVLSVLGTAKFLALYVSAVVVAFIPTTIRHADEKNYSSVGASGAIAAVIFSAILLHPGMKLGLLFLPILVPGPIYGLAYLAYSVYQAWGERDGVNHTAHFAGAIYGVLFTYALEPARVRYGLAHFF
ncbi:MAG: rhomboid family intramembrane serine protease [Polyangiaceae bacterium]